jgi:hypothetical protein
MGETIAAVSNAVMRIAFAGDSITWGDGMPDDGFVGRADEYIRERCATTLTIEQLEVFGVSQLIKSRKFYRSDAVKLMGVGSGVRFDWNGDELSIVQAIERSNASTSVIDLFVDGLLYDSFTNWNASEVGTAALSFIGDGEKDQFDLGRAFTYDHTVSVDGMKLSGALNVSGYGGSFPAEADYMVIRKIIGVMGERQEVHHVMWFRIPPPKDACIDVEFSYGETIAYAKTTVGETGRAIDTLLESRYGVGEVAFDPARPSSISSGLDFRESDARAVKTWRFPTTAIRSCELVIRGLDPNSERFGEPYFILNFITNRYHAIMNAGIGGWTAKRYNTDLGLRSSKAIAEWAPDIVILGLGTNDDWEAGNGFVASRCLDDLTESLVRRLPVLYLKNCKIKHTDSYQVETAELIISSIRNSCSVRVDGKNASFEAVKKGDILVIGNYYGDNRNVQCRLIEEWEESTRTARFADPLVPTEVTPDIMDYVGQSVSFKRADAFATQLIELIRTIRQSNPDVHFAIMETGLSNFNTRLLMGYPELIRDIARQTAIHLIPVYEPLMKWQYRQPQDIPVYIGPYSLQISSGASEYPLLNAAGKDVVAEQDYMLRNWSVLVNGEEIFPQGCKIIGGFALTFHPDEKPENLTLEDWNGRSSNPKTAYRFIPSSLVFTTDVPASGDRIEVRVSRAKWSLDDAHLNLPEGEEVYVSQVNKALELLMIRNGCEDN